MRTQMKIPWCEDRKQRLWIGTYGGGQGPHAGL
jgi:hypothetical protein